MVNFKHRSGRGGAGRDAAPSLRRPRRRRAPRGAHLGGGRRPRRHRRPARRALLAYKRIEVVLASNGGLAAAFDHYRAAQRRRRARGVRIATRAVSHAHSAAALVLSLGDGSIAGPAARLLYHPVRLVVPGALTAAGSAQMHADLSRLGAQHIGCLVERALDGAPVRSARPGRGSRPRSSCPPPT